MSTKQPTTTRVPDWERLFDQLLERQAHLMRVAAVLRAIGTEPSELAEELLQLGVRLRHIEQMRRITQSDKVSHAA